MKLQAKDLRIGNIVFCCTKGTPFIGQIKSLNKNGFIETDEFTKLNLTTPITKGPGIFGIPLTEQVFIDFGFSHSGNSFQRPGEISYYDKRPIEIMFYKDKGFVFEVNNYQILLGYIHQLQNVYFALIEQELM